MPQCHLLAPYPYSTLCLELRRFCYCMAQHSVLRNGTQFLERQGRKGNKARLRHCTTRLELG